MSDVENELRSRVDGFVEELSALIRRQALQAVEEVLEKGRGGAGAVVHAGHVGHAVHAGRAVHVGRGPGRPRKTEALAGVARKPGRPTKAMASPKRKAGEKRTPAELGQIVEQLLHYIRSNPNQGVEQIAKSLGTSTKELTLPIRKLLGDKRISSKGQKRATRYSPR
jgi:hypothetical protein